MNKTCRTPLEKQINITTCLVTYIVKEFSRITCSLLWKDLCKISLQLIDMGSYITSLPGNEPTDPSADGRNMLRLKYERNLCQVLIPKSFFQHGFFDSLQMLYSQNSSFFFYIDRFYVICSQSPRSTLYYALWLFSTISIKRLFDLCLRLLPRCYTL